MSGATRTRMVVTLAGLTGAGALALAPIGAVAQTAVSVESEAWGVSVSTDATSGGTQYVGTCPGCPLPVAVAPMPLAFFVGSAPAGAGQNRASLLGEPNPLEYPPGDGSQLTVSLMEQLAEGSVATGSAGADSETAGLLLAGGAVRVDVLRAVAHAWAGVDPGTGASGRPGAACEIYSGADGIAHFDTIGSTVAGLTVNGVSVSLSGSQGFCPRSLPGSAFEATLLSPGGAATGLTVRVYEVIPDRDGNGIQVNMVHITGNVVLSTGNVVSVDVIVGHAHAAVVTAEPQPNGGSAGAPAPIDIHKLVVPERATAGSTVTYQLTLTNRSQTQCQIESIADQLAPRYFRFTSKGVGVSNQASVAASREFESDGFQSAAGTTPVGDASANTMTWTSGPEYGLAPGRSMRETFEVDVDPKTPAGTYPDLVTVYAPLCGASGGTVLETSTASSSTAENLGAPLSIGPAQLSPTPFPSPQAGVQSAFSTHLPNTSGDPAPLLPLLPLLLAAPAVVALRAIRPRPPWINRD
ncbi:MAG: hypothetical protein ACYDAY_05465 [Candidatus Dormibacteria bacterium]